MKRQSLVSATLVALLGAALGFAQASYKIEPAGAPPSTGVPAPLAALLAPQGTRLFDAQRNTVSEVWWAKSVATHPSASSSPDILYDGLTVGELVGVIHLARAGSDFRGQAIKPGFYTLRYALMPEDGNHMGVSPYRDFLLLSQVAADTKPGDTLSFDDLLKLSRRASGTGHPAVMSLTPPEKGSAALPALKQDDQGDWVLHTKAPEKGGQSLPLGLILVGQAAQS